jgi:hypothetical protein
LFESNCVIEMLREAFSAVMVHVDCSWI